MAKRTKANQAKKSPLVSPGVSGPPATAASGSRQTNISPTTVKSDRTEEPGIPRGRELVIITGLSGSGKGSVLKVLEDAGFYAVDNMPVDLMPIFSDLVRDSPSISKAALVVDIREGEGLKRFPGIFKKLKQQLPTRLVFLEADIDALVRRFSETRRPHPLGANRSITASIEKEQQRLAPIRALADLSINTSKFTVHELRDFMREKFGGSSRQSRLMIYLTSFGYRHGLPGDSDLVFDVRFLPNPNFIPKFKKLTGRHPAVAKFIRDFPQTREFLERIGGLLIYLLPHYIREGKSYLTVGFGCTGGHHRSVMIAEQIGKELIEAGYPVKIVHRDIAKAV